MLETAFIQEEYIKSIKPRTWSPEMARRYNSRVSKQTKKKTEKKQTKTKTKKKIFLTAHCKIINTREIL